MLKKDSEYFSLAIKRIKQNEILKIAKKPSAPSIKFIIFIHKPERWQRSLDATHWLVGSPTRQLLTKMDNFMFGEKIKMHGCKSMKG